MTNAQLDDAYWMQQAMLEAEKAAALGEIPVGAVLVKDGEAIARAYNQPIALHDPSAHAEVQVLREAGRIVGNYRLLDTTLYVTLEPCPMCAGLMVHARIKRLVYGAPDYKTGAAGSVMNLLQDERLNHQVEVVSGVLQEQCSEGLSAFFRQRRAEKKRLKQAAKLQRVNGDMAMSNDPSPTDLKAQD